MECQTMPDYNGYAIALIEEAPPRWFSTIQRPDGRVRTKLWLGRKDPYRVGFTCAGPEATFAESATQCRDVLDHFEAR